MFLIACGSVVVAFWAYVFFLRPRLAARWPRTWAWFDKVEGWLVDRSRTLLAARLYWVGGFIVALHDQAASIGFDWTPLTDQIAAFLPPQYRTLALGMGLIMTGLLFDWLRHKTTAALQ